MVLRTVAATSLELTSNCGRLMTDLNLAAVCWNASRRSGEESGCARALAEIIATNKKIRLSRWFFPFIRACKLGGKARRQEERWEGLRKAAGCAAVQTLCEKGRL